MAIHGFTLVELLVVVAIIAILAGILLPTINMVKSSARTGACMSTQRQLGMANEIYCNDHHGHYVGLCDISNGTGGWWYNVQSFRDNLELRNVIAGTQGFPRGMLCAESLGAKLTTNSNITKSYGWNVELWGSPPRPTGTTRSMNMIHGGSADRCWLNRVQIIRRSERIALTDALDGWIVSSSSYLGKETASSPMSSAYRHRDCANALFWDGHSASLRRSAIDVSVNAGAEYQYWTQTRP